MRLLADVVAGPQLRKDLAVEHQLADQRRELGIARVDPGGQTQVGDGLLGHDLPVRVELLGGGVQEDVAQHVAPLARKLGEVAHQRRRHAIPRQHVHAPAENEGRRAVHRVEQALHPGAHALGRGGAADPRARLDQAVQVLSLGLVEMQGAGDGVQDAFRGVDVASLLQAHVVVGADPGQLGELLAAQAGHAAAAEVRQPDVLGAQPRAPRAQEGTKLGARVHGPSVPGTVRIIDASVHAFSVAAIARPSLGLPVPGCADVWLAAPTAPILMP